MAAPNGQLFRAEAYQDYAGSGAVESAPHTLAPSTPALTGSILALSVLALGLVAFVPVPVHLAAAATYDAVTSTLVTCLPPDQVAAAVDVQIVVGAGEQPYHLDPRAGRSISAPPQCAIGDRAAVAGTRWDGVDLPAPLPTRVRAELPSQPLGCVLVGPCR